MKAMKTAIGAVATLLLFWCSQGAAAPFSELVVFGDSLSDDGAYYISELDDLVPDYRYYYNGRFSNGPVWAEYLSDANRLNVPLTDWALGGAQTGGLTPPGLTEQVLLYTLTEGPPSADALFAIWIGGNDYLNGSGDVQAAIGNIRDALDELAQFGTRHLLVLNLPDLGVIPKKLGDSDAGLATEFSVQFNAGLAAMLDEFATANPQIEIYEFDVYSFYILVRSDPMAYGFNNVTEPSPNFDVENNFDNSAGHVFWDDLHPTTEMHVLVADNVFAVLNAQPGEGSDDDSDSSSCFIGSVAGDM